MKKLTDDNFHDIEKILSDAWLNVRIDDAQIEETFQKIPPDFSDCPELFITWVLSQPDFFSFTCKELFGLHILPFQGIVLEELWNRKFPMMVCTRGFSKTLLLGVYALLRAIFGRNEKIVICGSSFRQSKLVFNYIENLIENSPILRDIVYFGKNNPIQHHNDNYKISIGSSYIIGVPLGTGDKIRGLRASVILTDEFSSIPIDIFETVIAGFAAVSSNPADKVRRLARERMAEKLGIVLEDSTSLQGIGGNQIVISGTAYYDFNHFAQYHKRWTEIIKSRGDSERLKKALGSDTDINLNWKDFSIIRVPALLLPEGYMDADQLSRSKATMTSSNFEMEFSCVFSKDSQGFFKRKMIEACVVKPGEDWVLPDNKVIPSNEIFFEPMLRGDPNKEYVFAIDPAARLDNFSIVILERNIGYRKIVYCWTTNEKRHKKQAESGFVKEKNYYAFCCRKIRDLMRNFNCVGIGIDYGGGGGAIIAGLQDEDKIEQLELPIYHRIDYTKPRDTDGKSGLHLIYEINFNTEWSQQANHSLRKDMEDKILVFPYIDGISYIDADESLEVDELKMEKDKPISIDPYSEVVFEIEELKNELSMIVVTETATGKEHWDTPETKTNTGKKTRLRKDRYSALLMANDTCRKIFEDESVPRLSATDGGGFASAFKNTEKSSLFKSGPNWAINALSSAYD